MSWHPNISERQKLTKGIESHLLDFKDTVMTNSTHSSVQFNKAFLHKMAQLHLKFQGMGLCHPTDGSTSTKYKLLCFMPP